MSIFHCIPESCARVVYREYLPPSVRYRYPGEDWQYVDGDDYSTELIKPEIPDNSLVFWRARITWKYSDDNLIVREYTPHDLRFGSYTQAMRHGKPLFDQAYSPRDRLFLPYETVSSDGSKSLTYYNLYVSRSYKAIDWEFYSICIVNSGSARDCSDSSPEQKEQCLFTVTKNGAIAHTETRDICPEVEKLDCRLSEQYKSMEIDKVGYLQGVEVVNFARDLSFSNKEIPQHCLNIYKTVTQQSIISFQEIFLFYEFIAQICSAPTCPPPEYQVLCNCDCEPCPGGTCAVECGDHVCCYDTVTGKAVREIPKIIYCEK